MFYGQYNETDDGKGFFVQRKDICVGVSLYLCRSVGYFSRQPMHRIGSTHPSKLPTPVRAARLEAWLKGYDGGQKQKLVSGLKRGFDVGYKGSLPRVRPHNLTSALQNPRGS